MRSAIIQILTIITFFTAGAQEYMLKGIQLEYDYSRQDGYADGTGTCGNCWTQVNRQPHYGVMSSGQPVVLPEDSVLNSDGIDLVFWETRSMQVNDPEPFDYCYGNVKDRDFFSNKMTGYCEARRFDEYRKLKVGEAVEYGNSGSQDLEDFNRMKPQSYARIWMLPHVREQESRRTALGSCELLFEGRSYNVPDGEWQYQLDDQQEWKPVPEDSFRTLFPLSVTGDQLAEKLPEHLGTENTLRLRFVLRATGSGHYQEWHSKTVQAASSSPREATAILGPYTFNLISCSPRLSQEHSPNPLPIAPSCAFGADGTFTVVFERSLDTERQERLNLELYTLLKEQEVLLDTRVLTSESFSSQAYTWPEELSAGKYRIAWQSKSGGQSITSNPDAYRSSDWFEITDPESLGLLLKGTSLKCREVPEGKILAEATGGIPPYRYSLDDGTSWQEAPEFTGLYSGNYLVRVQDSKGCVSAAEITLLEPISKPELQLLQLTEPTGFGKNNGMIQVLATGGIPPYTYSWTKDGEWFSADQLITSLGPGVYQGIASDSEGCESEVLELVLTEPDPLVVMIYSEPQMLNCPDDQAVLYARATGGKTEGAQTYSYRWTNGSTGAVLSGVSQGSYGVEVMDINGNTALGNYELLAPPPLEVNPVSEQVYCRGSATGSISLDPSGGTLPYQVNWYRAGDPEFARSGPTIEQLSAGLYFYVITDARGCRLDNFHSGIQIGEPQLDLRAVEDPDGHRDLFQHGDSDGVLVFSLQGGTPPYVVTLSSELNSYVLNVSGQEARFENLPGGDYTLILTDEQSCVFELQEPVRVVEPKPLELMLTEQGKAGCTDVADGYLKLEITGGIPPYTLELQDHMQYSALNEGPFRIDGLREGHYQLRVQDASGKGVEASLEFNIETADRMNISAQIMHNSCFGAEQGSIAVAVSGGTPPYIYEWNTGATQARIDALGSGHYLLRVTDLKGCSEWQEFEIRAPEEVPEVVFDKVVRPNNAASADGEIAITVKGLIQDFDLYWTGPGGFSSGQEDLKDLREGNYVLKVYLKDSACEFLFDYELVARDVFEAELNIVSGIWCFAGEEGMLEAEVTGGTPPFSYHWQVLEKGAYRELPETEAVLEYAVAGWYRVRVRDADGRVSQSEAVELTQPDPLQIFVTKQTAPGCFGGSDGSIEVEATGGTPPYRYFWDQGGQGNLITDRTSGIYEVRVVDDQGCMAELQVALPETTTPLLLELNAVAPSAPGSSDGRIIAHASGGKPPYTYAVTEVNEGSWSLMEAREQGYPAGQYEVKVTDSGNCEQQGTVILAPPAPYAVYQADPACPGECDGSIQVVPLPLYPGTQVIWEDGFVGNARNALCFGLYRFTVLLPGGQHYEEEVRLAEPGFQQPELPELITLCAEGAYRIRPFENTSGLSLRWWKDGALIGTGETLDAEHEGDYELWVDTVSGCTLSFPFEVKKASLQASPEFIVASQGFVGERLTAVEVSVPAPDQVVWDLPDKAVQLTATADYLEFYFTEAGSYELKASLTFGSCTVAVVKRIQIMEADLSLEGGGEAGLQVNDIRIYPNPSSGHFSIGLDFPVQTNCKIRIFRLSNNAAVVERLLTGAAHYDEEFNIQASPPGMYAVVIETATAYYVKKLIRD